MLERLKEAARSVRDELSFYRRVVQHPETPLASRMLLGLAVGYALLPFDLIPDGIPVVGYLDDVIVVPLLVIAGRSLVPGEVLAECRRQAAEPGGGASS